MSNSSPIRISVVIQTCDRKDLLLQSLASVFAQTRPADEIIVVNNGKDELSLPSDIVGKVTVQRIMPYAGVAQARNFGAGIAKHEYLAFLDDDDLWSPDYLKQVSEAFEQKEECVIGRLDKLENGEVSDYKNAAGLISVKNILRFNPGITGSNIALTKKAFFIAGGFDPKLPPSEDKSLVLELLQKKLEVTVLENNSAIHRVHGGNRLSGNARMAEGIGAFTRKYRALMSTTDFCFNRYKYFKYRYQSGKKVSFLGYVFFSIAYKTAQVFSKE